jgi:hypothetical protein
MLREDALELIQRTAVQAAGASILPVPGDERLAYLVNCGQCSPLELPPKPRAHAVNKLDEFCRFVSDYEKRIAAGKLTAEESGGVVVFHGPGSVVAILHDADRRDRVSLKLAATAAWEWISAAERSPPKLAPKDFLTLLRTKLADCVAADALHDWQVALRNVRLTKRTTADSTIDRGLERLGKEIQNECAGIEAVPETLVVKTEIYRNVATVPVEIAFDVSIDFDNCVFVLTVIGDRVANAVDGAQESIGEQIRVATGLDSVFHGTP